MDFLKQNSATREDLGMLAVMDALAGEQQVTQRELSRRTGLNLKKVNYCLHKLLEEGYIKFQRAMHNPDKRTYLYILTPPGLKAKSRLTYRFLQFTLEFYNQVEFKLQRCLKQMEKAGVQRMVLCGASDVARVVMGQVSENGIEVVGMLDKGYEEADFDGVPVLQEEDLKVLEWDGLLITALEDLEELEEDLGAMELPDKKIWQLA